jgi:F-type H+-transporting ATPase subunit a
MGNYSVHGQVLMTTWFVFAIIATIAFAGNSDLKAIPEGLQNLTEYITEFIRDLAKTQIGEEEYVKWVPFLGTIFLFVLSQTGPDLIPWHLIEIPNGELAAPTNDKYNSCFIVTNFDCLFLCGY